MYIGNRLLEWAWQEMVAQMDEDSMRFIVEGEGPDHRSRGLVGCRLQQMDKYDHKRAHARRAYALS